SSRRRHTRSYGDWSSDVCSSDLIICGGLRSALGNGGLLVLRRELEFHVGCDAFEDPVLQGERVTGGRGDAAPAHLLVRASVDERIVHAGVVCRALNMQSQDEVHTKLLAGGIDGGGSLGDGLIHGNDREGMTRTQLAEA